ncbi:DUF1636 domain-containing protein [Rhodopseudomonas palustris]|uniref:DUF1636 domain-containing protein n=1 Tax=Rhodopseudomonas palustris TaxID=1076 RepID=UPI002ACE2493|nr:DUF1636 domain-containing protein [Rhodopseudomonas palustris]WQG98989.1 DUF1636 domain-containing protein [Rhodopseudomonas palustris]
MANSSPRAIRQSSKPQGADPDGAAESEGMNLSPDDHPTTAQGVEPTEISARPSDPVMISVCTSCKASDGGNAGAPLLDAIRAALGGADDLQVRPVQCLGVCKRPATVAVSSADGYSFLFGDLLPDTGAAAIAAFAAAYRDNAYGLVPWRQRAEVLRKGMVARLPPLRWSPDDGRSPS